MRLKVSHLKEMIRDELSRFVLTEDKGEDAYPGELGVGTPTGTPAETDADVAAEEQETTSQMHPDDPTDPSTAEKQKTLRQTQELEDEKRFQDATGE